MLLKSEPGSFQWVDIKLIRRGSSILGTVSCIMKIRHAPCMIPTQADKQRDECAWSGMRGEIGAVTSHFQPGATGLSRVRLNDKWSALASQFLPSAWRPLWSPMFSEHCSGKALRNHKAVTRKCLWVWGQESEERPRPQRVTDRRYCQGWSLASRG